MYGEKPLQTLSLKWLIATFVSSAIVTGIYIIVFVYPFQNIPHNREARIRCCAAKRAQYDYIYTRAYNREMEHLKEYGEPEF